MRLRIAYINPTRLIRRPLAELANRFKGSAVLVPRPIFKKHKNPWHNKLKCKVYTYPSIQIPFMQFDWPIPIGFEFFRVMKKLFKEHDIIHIWTFFYISSWYAMLLRLYSKTKLVMSVDTLPGISFPFEGIIDSLFFKILYRLKFLFKIPDCIHVYTTDLLRLFYEQVEENPSWMMALPTGIDIKKFDKTKRKFHSNQLYILFVGEIKHRKGVDRLFKIAKKINDCFIRFLIIGNGPCFKKYLKKSKNIKNLFMVGWSDDLPQDLKNSDVLILLSRGEGLPGIVMEAMACGLPVIATDIYGNRELIKNGKTGFLVNSEDEAIACILKLKDKKLREKMGKAGYRRIKNYDWNNIINAYKGMYEQC